MRASRLPGSPAPGVRLDSRPGLRVGISLPQFREDAGPALAVARRAEQAGVDGVFVFDHLWPLGRPDRPALHSASLLGALVVETERVVLGTLVARVGLVPDAVLVHTLVTLHRMAGNGRFIAGIGTGDKANRAENEAYGLRFAPAAERLASVRWCLEQLREAGVHTWAGGLSKAVERVAAEADGWNLWGLAPDEFAARVRGCPVEPTWAGQVLIGWDEAEVAANRERFGDRPGVLTGTVDDLAAHLRAVREAGATWAVCAPLNLSTQPEAPNQVARATRSAWPERSDR